ncbi:hypothetical protein MASR1M60_31700 [Rhodocyclaceae bacterium]
MQAIKPYLLTGIATLSAGAVLLAGWMYRHPLEIPRLARVDIARLVSHQQQSMVQRIKPGIDAQEQARIFDEAKAFGARLDAALDQVSRECACALVNTAALLKTSDARIPDLTEQVAQATGLALPAATVK